MIDILMTTYNRVEFLKKTLDSLFQKTRDISYRLFIVDDCSTDETPEYLSKLGHENLCHVSLSKRRHGVRYGFNLLWSESKWYDAFYEDFPYLCYFQDDVEILEDGWLGTLLEAYEEFFHDTTIGQSYILHSIPCDRQDRVSYLLLLLQSSGCSSKA